MTSANHLSVHYIPPSLALALCCCDPAFAQHKAGLGTPGTCSGVHLGCSILLLVPRELDGYSTTLINLRGKVYSINYLLEN